MPTKIKTFDILLVIIPLIFIVTSVAVIYSLVFGTNSSDLVYRQGVAAILGILIMAFAAFSDYRFIRGTSWIFYIVSIVLLIIANFFGKTAGGAKSWIDLGFYQLQPSEVTKAFLIFTLASYFSSRIGKLRWRDLFWSAVILLIPLALILSEPDLGTALVIVFIYLVFVFISKPTKLQSGLILGTITVFSSILFLSAFKVPPFQGVLKEYQRNRILNFVYPERDLESSGYNVRQAQISVGSGGLLGKGLGHGSQSQLQFLPVPHTDFIFAGIAESFGFVGAATFLLLYFLLIIRIINVGLVAQDNFGMLIAFGVAGMHIFQVVENVGMNIGIAPVTGIPLPLLSYGGTAVIVSLFLIGLVQSIFIRHRKISFEE